MVRLECPRWRTQTLGRREKSEDMRMLAASAVCLRLPVLTFGFHICGDEAFTSRAWDPTDTVA